MDSETPLRPDSVIVASDSVLSTALADEVVLLDPQEGMYYSLNEVGARIWELIQEPASMEAICARIVEEFEVEAEACAQDTTRLIGELTSRGLVRLASLGQ